MACGRIAWHPETDSPLVPSKLPWKRGSWDVVAATSVMTRLRDPVLRDCPQVPPDQDVYTTLRWRKHRMAKHGDRSTRSNQSKTAPPMGLRRVHPMPPGLMDDSSRLRRSCLGWPIGCRPATSTRWRWRPRRVLDSDLRDLGSTRHRGYACSACEERAREEDGCRGLGVTSVLSIVAL